MALRLKLCLLLPAALLAAGCGGSSSTFPPANLVGTWGGGTTITPAALTLSTTGGALNFPCGAADVLNQPLSVDSAGHFDVTATVHLSVPTVPVPGGTLPQVHLVGTVTGRTMTISEVYASGTGTAYTLTYGQSAPSFNGACPA